MKKKGSTTAAYYYRADITLPYKPRFPIVLSPDALHQKWYMLWPQLNQVTDKPSIFSCGHD
jgi:hypothetical protein